MIKPVWTTNYDHLLVSVYANKEELGQAAAAKTAIIARQLLEQKQLINLLFSTGASQFTFVDALGEHEIEWPKIQGFHLDEYVNMADDHPASFRLWLRTRIEKRFHPAVFHYVQGDAPSGDEECKRYAGILAANPIDIGFIGIGENGHIAFNDPPVADFQDPESVKIVELDEACRQQQYGEGWFPSLEEVPKRAITLTVPTIMKCQQIISVVPDQRKAEAVYHALRGPISTTCPASILRTHKNAELFLDLGSAEKLGL